MLEKEIEKYLRDEVKKLGGIAYKFVSPGNAGVPDRLVCLPEGILEFVELKAPGKTTRPLQDLQIEKLRSLGQRVSIIDSKKRVDELASEWRKLIARKELKKVRVPNLDIMLDIMGADDK